MSFLSRPHDAPASRSPRQEDLLVQLEAVITAEGFRSVTIAELADRLHCSRRTLYELADSKEDLVALVVGRFLERNFSQGVIAMDGVSTMRGRIEAFTSAVIQHVRTASAAFADDVFRTPRTAEIVAAYDQRCIALLQGLVRDGCESGEFRPVHSGLVAHGLMAAIARVQDLEVLAMLDLSYPDAIHQMISVLLDGVAAARPSS